MTKQIYLFGAVLFISFFLSCKHERKETNQNNQPVVIKLKSRSLVYGIDISHYQNNEVDFISKNLDSLSFVIWKATEGVTYTDLQFSKNRKVIKVRSFIRGAYHFYHSKDDLLAQAAHFVNTITNLENTDMPLVIDFEQGRIDASQSVDEIQSVLKIFMNEVQKKSNRKPIIYPDLNTGNKYLKSTYFSNYALWIANYNGKKSPVILDT